MKGIFLISLSVLFLLSACDSDKRDFNQYDADKSDLEIKTKIKPVTPKKEVIKYEFGVYKENGILWKYGVAFIDGKAAYIDPNRLDQGRMTLPNSIINKYIKENKEVIRDAIIDWNLQTGRMMWVYDITLQAGIYSENLDTRRIYYIKIENNKTYLSEDRKTWDVLQIEVLKDKLVYPDPKDKFDAPVYMEIRLKCKFFEGDYEIIGATG